MSRVSARCRRATGGRLAVALLVLAAISSCRPYHMYAGDHRPPSEVSAVRQTKRVVLLEIDGADTGLSNQFRILPGAHSISVQIQRIQYIPSAYRDRRAKESRQPVCACIFELFAQQGTTYLVDSRELSDGRWIAWAGPMPASDERDVEPETLAHCTCESG